MKNKNCYIAACWLLLSCLTGCEKNESFYYSDNDYPGVAIFSNTGYNVLSCFMDGTPWKTLARRTGDGFGAVYISELAMRRIKTTSLLDTLLITWRSSDDNTIQYDIILTLPIEKQFQWKDIAAFQGKRIIIDSTNGYFSLGQYYNSYTSFNGKGVIYFNTARIDSLSPDYTTGRISGLLEAHFYPGTPLAHNITSGRFDDNITAAELRNY